MLCRKVLGCDTDCRNSRPGEMGVLFGVLVVPPWYAKVSQGRWGLCTLRSLWRRREDLGTEVVDSQLGVVPRRMFL